MSLSQDSPPSIVGNGLTKSRSVPTLVTGHRDRDRCATRRQSKERPRDRTLARNLDLGAGKVKGRRARDAALESRRLVPRERAAHARRIDATTSARARGAGRASARSSASATGSTAVLGFGGMGVVYRARDLQARPGDRAEAHPPRPRLARAARDAAARDHPVAQGDARERLPRLRPRRDRRRGVRLDGVPAGQDAQGDRGEGADAAAGARPRDRQGHLRRASRRRTASACSTGT